MKTYLSLCLFLGLCALAATGVRADDDDDKPIKAPHDPDVYSPTYDGSTYTITQEKQPTAAEVQAESEARQQQSTWLIRSYEQQVKVKSTADGQIDLLDPYERISSDKDLAKLAGVTPTSAPNPLETTSLHADTDPLKDGPTLRLDPTPVSPQPKYPPMTGTGFKPLITPLSATEAAGLHNFYATLPAGTPPPVLANSSPPAPVPPAADGSSLVEMPGLAAAQSHVTPGNLSYDLTEALPDETPNKPAAASENDVLPQPPSGDATRQLHRAVLAVTTGKNIPPPVPARVVIPPDPDLIPKPITVPVLMAGRPQIQDPNDAFR